MSTSVQEVIDALPAMAKQANKACGCSYEVYIRRVSSMIDNAVAGLSAEDQAAVRAVAVQTVDYSTPAELAAADAELAEQGYCCHGLTEDTCPCGCFEGDDDWHDEHDTWERVDAALSVSELTWEQHIQIAVLEAKIEICAKTISALESICADEDGCDTPDIVHRILELAEKQEAYIIELEQSY